MRQYVPSHSMIDVTANGFKHADGVYVLEQDIPRWIPVGERLPEHSCRVLTAGLQKYPVVCSFWATDNTFRDGNLVDGVTHWMPLPAPPEVTP